jgi:hypothetical protein
LLLTCLKGSLRSKDVSNLNFGKKTSNSGLGSSRTRDERSSAVAELSSLFSKSDRVFSESGSTNTKLRVSVCNTYMSHNSEFGYFQDHLFKLNLPNEKEKKKQRQWET